MKLEAGSQSIAARLVREAQGPLCHPQRSALDRLRSAGFKISYQSVMAALERSTKVLKS